MEATSDQDLLEELMQGSQEAFSVIYERYWKRLFLFIYSKVNDVKQSQDILQDLFVSLWERKAALQIANLNAYLYASARYGVLRWMETRKEDNRFVRSALEFSVSSSKADDQVISAELRTAYRAMVDQMPQQRKKIFQLRHEEDLNTRQIAETLNISQKTVQNQLQRSYRHFRTLLPRFLSLFF